MNRKERRQREKLRRTRGASPIPEGLQDAVSLHQMGRVGEALPLYQTFLANQPRHPDALNYCGLAMYQLGDANRALGLIEAAIKVEPTNAGAYNNLGLVFQKLDRMDDAEDAYRMALKLQPKASQAHSNLANVLQTNGRFDEAVEIYHRAIAIKPDSAEALNNLGNVLKKQRKLTEALSAYRQALKYQPDNPDTHNNLGVLLQATGQSNEAIDAFHRSLGIKPDNAEAYFNLGGAYRELGRVGEAITAYQKAIEMKPDLDVYDSLGTLFLDDAALNKATPMLQKAIENPNGDPKVSTHLAALLADGDDLAGAEALARSALQANGQLPSAAISLAKVLVEKGDIEGALATYETVGKASGQDMASHMAFAVTLLRQQRIREGLGVIDRLLPSPRLTVNQRYALFIHKGIYAWLQEDLDGLADTLRTSEELAETIDRTTIDISLCIYQLYLERLLRYRKKNPAIYEGDAPGRLHVVGESHALSPNGTLVAFEGTTAKAISHLLIGCKAWHLGQSKANYFQRGLQAILKEIPEKATVLFTFGEIDCRHNEGIHHHHRKHGGDLNAIIQKTVEGYVAFVATVAVEKGLRPIFVGVPAPHCGRPTLNALPTEERKAYLAGIAGFNETLKATAAARGATFLDTYGRTAGPDRMADGTRHIDHHHLIPSFLRDHLAA